MTPAEAAAYLRDGAKLYEGSRLEEVALLIEKLASERSEAERDGEAVKLLERCLPNLYGGSWAHMTNGPCDCKKCIREKVQAFLERATSPRNIEEKK